MSAIVLAERSETDATSDAGIFTEAADRFEIAMVAEADSRTRGVEAKNFRWGDQWPDDIKNDRDADNRPSLTMNHTNTMCARVENQIRQDRARIKVQAVGAGANVDTADVISGIIRHIEAVSAANVAYNMGAASAIDIGWGYWRVLSKYIDEKSFDQELLICPIRNTFSVYMDPMTVMPDGRDQGWCLLVTEMKRAEYKRKYPKANNAEFTLASIGDGAPNMAQWDNPQQIRLAEYYRIHEVNDTLYRMNDGRTMLESEVRANAERFALMGLLPAVDEYTGKEIMRKTSRREVQWFKLNGRDVVDRRVLKGRHIPVVRSLGNEMCLNDLVKRKGMVQDLIDPARMYNYWRTAETERYGLAPKAPWVAAEGQTDGHSEWHDANRKSYSVLTYKPVSIETGQGAQILPPPQRQMPVPVEEGFAQAAAGAEHDLMAVAGIPAEDPTIRQQVVSGSKHAQYRQGQADLVHFQYYDNHDLALSWTGELLLELIPFYYDTQRVQRIIGEDGKPKQVTINEQEQTTDDSGNAVTRVLNDLTVGRYAVVMDSGPGYATQREEAAENQMALLATPLGEVIAAKGPDIVIRNQNFHGAQELADRIAASTPGALDDIMKDLPKQAQTIIQQLQQQIQEQGEQLKDAQLEIAYGQGKERMRIQGDLEKTDRNNETAIRKQELGDTTRRDVAEINAATQLLNTKAEQEHEENMSDKLIAEGVSNAQKD